MVQSSFQSTYEGAEGVTCRLGTSCTSCRMITVAKVITKQGAVETMREKRWQQGL